jgi:glycosyltransferase involved in cell wall biosynthesis
VAVVTWAGGGVRRAVALPRLLRRLRAALLHSPVAALPGRCPCPSIATVHDLPWLVRPRLRERGCGLRHRRAARRAAHAGTVVVCPSAATREALLGWLGADTPRAQVVVVPHGVVAPRSPADLRELAGPLLVLGDRRPRKNLARVVRAHARARASDGRVPELRLVGPPHGFVSEDEKWRILRTSTALLHFSLLEGFGLPVLEAFHHGVPVACSDRAGLAELAGDAALAADPLDEDALARAIVRISTDSELRASLRSRGLGRAKALTPERTAAAWQRLHAEVVR